MTVVVDRFELLNVPDESPIAPAGEAIGTDVRPLTIGLLNNMPDTALQATERQFLRLLHAAASQQLVRLHFYSLPTIQRSSEAKERLEASYDAFPSIRQAGLDGLIVTGAEPKTASLRDESYWDELAEIIAWAKDNTVSTIWSCLAAHAAVLQLDGIERRRLADKCSGVFACHQGEADALTTGLRWPLRIFHSRHNDLAERGLLEAGYRILSRTEESGIDIFTKNFGSLFVFFQGHPEYDSLSLQREYLRDVSRYLSGEQRNYPAIPSDYFDAATTSSLQALRQRALAHRNRVTTTDCRDILDLATVNADRRGAAAAIFRNWLAVLQRGRPQH